MKEEQSMTNWKPAAKRYLERLGFAEYKAQLTAHRKRGRKQTTMRYTPSAYHEDLIKFLNDDNEEGFKATKTFQGYAEALKC